MDIQEVVNYLIRQSKDLVKQVAGNIIPRTIIQTSNRSCMKRFSQNFYSSMNFQDRFSMVYQFLTEGGDGEKGCASDLNHRYYSIRIL